MSKEINVSVSLGTNKNNAPYSVSFSSNPDQAGTGRIGKIVTVTTSWVELDLTAVVPGWVLVKNTDATNFIEIAEDDVGAHKFGKLLAGESMLWRKNGKLYVKADTASCDAFVVALAA